MVQPEETNLRGELTDQLATLMRANVVVERFQQKSLDGTTVVVADIRYWRDKMDSGKTRGKQTVVLLDEVDLDLPKFELSPNLTGIIGKLSGMLGDGAFIEFDDVAEFDQHYRVHGWATEAVNLLFRPSLRQSLASSPGWSFRGNKNLLLVFRSNELVGPADTDAFISNSLSFLSLFQQAENDLDHRPHVKRQATPEDVSAAASQMTGLTGSLFRRVLEKYGSRAEDIEQLIESSLPRQIPKSVATQVIGNNLPAFFLGILFVAIGIVIGGSLAIFGEQEAQQVGGIFLLAFPLIGSVLSFFVMRHRIRKFRLLRDGIVCKGKIADIESPPRPGSEGAYYTIKVKYQMNGAKRELRQQVTEMVASQAENLRSSDSDVRVLVDQGDSTHKLCVDLLLIVG